MFLAYQDEIDGIRHYRLEIPLSQLAQAKLYDHDRWLLAECETSDKISDKLLALELLARRIEEAHGEQDGNQSQVHGQRPENERDQSDPQGRPR